MTTSKNMTDIDVADVAANTAETTEAVPTSTLESLLSTLSASSPFSKLLISIRRSVGVRLPNTALLELPTVLGPDTQERLVEIGERLGFMAAGEVILKSIDEINNGSLETVDKVIRKRLGNTTEVVKADADKDNTDNSSSVEPTEVGLDSNKN